MNGNRFADRWRTRHILRFEWPLLRLFAEPFAVHMVYFTYPWFYGRKISFRTIISFSAANYVTRIEYTLDIVNSIPFFSIVIHEQLLLTSDDTLDCVSSLHFGTFLLQWYSISLKFDSEDVLEELDMDW